MIADANGRMRQGVRQMKRCAPAAERNAEPILAVLRDVLPERGTVLEIASGTGQHAVHMARALPEITWQPTDPDADARASIAAWVADVQLPNLRPPLALDVTGAWPIDRADAVVCINMIHISPWSATEALFAGAARVLPPGGLLYTYGPYRFHGSFTAPSNAAFDADLRARNPDWGVRDVDDLQAAATAAGYHLERTVSMPANNHSLIFRLLAVAILGTALAACGGGGGDDDDDAPDASVEAGPCTIVPVANEGWTHVAEGTPLDPAHNPPASGNHYPIWARWAVHTDLARGYWIHNLEHGGVVLLYHPDAAQTDIDAMLAIYEAIPDDPACGHKRALITGDTQLDTDTAVVAADFAIEGTCTDQAAILDFVADHRAHAPENVCAPGGI
jgi:SAM-dependent methyltransferase